MMFKKIKGETAAAPHHSVTAKIIKSLKNAKTFFFVYFEGAQFCGESWKPTPAKSEG